eukprot:768434-Hanusia_phi.AAC.2
MTGRIHTVMNRYILALIPPTLIPLVHIRFPIDNPLPSDTSLTTPPRKERTVEGSVKSKCRYRGRDRAVHGGSREREKTWLLHRIKRRQLQPEPEEKERSAASKLFPLSPFPLLYLSFLAE